MKKRWCPMTEVVVWFKRATGIGYMDFPSVGKNPVVIDGTGHRLKTKADEVVREVERLEAELRRLGIRSNSSRSW